MSRFIKLLGAQTKALDQQKFKSILLDILDRLNTRSRTFKTRFHHFVEKTTPHSLCTYKNLYSCSKEISAYGVHNQRSQISSEAELAGEVAIDKLFTFTERDVLCQSVRSAEASG